MPSTLQIRSIDPALAQAAKHEAARRRMTLSDYLKELIAKDLRARSATEHRRTLYREIAHRPDGGRVTRDDTAAALAAARREMGLR